MTVSATSPSIGYTGNGSATVFPVPFKFIDAADLVVTIKPTGGVATVLLLGSGYTVMGAGVDGGGSLTTSSAPASGAALTITRSTPATQPTSLTLAGTFSPKTHERMADRNLLVVQETQTRTAALEGRISSVEATQIAIGQGNVSTLPIIVTAKSKGATGDGVTADQAAFVTAMNAVAAAGGGEVWIANGTYRLTSTFSVPPGVTLVGESRDGCILKIDHANATTDGILFPAPSSGLSRGGGLRNLTVQATSASTCRDTVSVTGWYGMRFQNISVCYAGRYGLYLGAVLDIELSDCDFNLNHTAGLYVDETATVASVVNISTTVRVNGGRLHGTTDGPGADVACNGISFNGSIFESNGGNTRSAGVGIRVRSGIVRLDGCYYENNAMWDVDAGTDASKLSQVTIDGFTITGGTYKQSGVGGFRLDHCDGGYVGGGKFPSMDKSLVFRAACVNVHADIEYTTTEPEWEGTGGIAKYQGIIRTHDGAFGIAVLEGNYALRTGGGPLVTNTFAGSLVVASSTSIPNGSAVEFVVPVTGVTVNDSVRSISLQNAQSFGLVYSAVCQTGGVRVAVTNSSGGTGSLGACTIKVLVERYS
jgi:hypothetical protein